NRVDDFRLGERVVVVEVVEPQRELVAGVPHDVAAEYRLVDGAVFLARRQILDIAVAVQARGRPFREHRVAEGHVDRRFDVSPVERAGDGGHIAAELLSWALRPDPDSAACRVAAEPRAMRAAQHLDAIEVDEFAYECARRIDLPDAVDIRADVRNAAHTEARS